MKYQIIEIDIKPDYVTIHQDKFDEWKHFYTEYGVEVRIDNECLWSDGNKDGVFYV